MNLKDFVAESLREIIDGVVEGQKHGKLSEAIINPPPTYLIQQGQVLTDHATGVQIQMIDFDVAVTVREGTSTSGGMGLVVGPVALGTKGKSDAASESVSRIRFTVPVAFPPGREREPARPVRSF